ncbi:MAG: hypothetical protein D6734_02390 [Candidatus Schekmanbacteria bacterium]|nr:MAG: hypothetical protein D6734_02390 [Candidatus Schekmanbacteria bacterium]
MEMNNKRNIQNFLIALGIIISTVSFLWEYFFPVVILYRNIAYVVGLLISLSGAIMFVVQLKRKRQTLQKIGKGTVSLFSIIVTAVILIIINLLSYGNGIRIDLTRTGKYSLSEETLKVISSLQEDVKFIGFFQEGSEAIIPFRDLMDEYKFRSKKIDYEIVDPDKNPALAKKYDVRAYNTIVVDNGKNVRKINLISESAFTNALIQVKTTKRKLICFLTGHGEKNILSSDSDKNGYSLIKKTLEGKGYDVKNLDLFNEKSIPENCSLIIIAGPVKDFVQEEIDQLTKYVESGGSLALLLDPGYSGKLIDFARSKNIIFSANVVANPPTGIFGNDPLVTIIKNYGRHPAVAGFQVYSVFPIAQAIGYDEKRAAKSRIKATFERIFITDSRSWIEKDGKRPYQYNPPIDKGGPVAIGGIFSEIKTEDEKAANILAIGDSDFISNAYLGISGNSDVFVNCIRWITDQEDMIVIPRKPREFSSVNITRSEGNMLFISSVITFPGIILLVGAFIFLKRRKL